MTRNEYLRLRPGDIIMRKRDRKLRIVAESPGTTHYGALIGLSLIKIGHSWTDPRPIASYDAWVILTEYRITRKKGMSLDSIRRRIRKGDEAWNTRYLGRFRPKKSR